MLCEEPIQLKKRTKLRFSIVPKYHLIIYNSSKKFLKFNNGTPEVFTSVTVLLIKMAKPKKPRAISFAISHRPNSPI